MNKLYTAQIICTASAVFFVLFVTPYKAQAYDAVIGHPGLTELAARLYNNVQKNGIGLTDKQIQWLKQGAVEEDTPFRWMNHFYDPVHNKGFKGEFLTSKDWSRNMPKQARYSKGDQTWQRALFSYHKGMEHEAFLALGHVLHLIQDITVPAHTRDDSHFPDVDYYEIWVKDNFAKQIITANILELKFLDNYFDNVANFSNQHFYSNNTIDSKLFNEIPVTKLQNYSNNNGNSGFIISTVEKREYRLLKFIKKMDWKEVRTQQSIIDRITLNDDFVLSDYYSLLGAKAVSAGAGVIDLFFKTYETEPQQEVLLFQTHPLGVVQEAVADAGLGTVSAWNTLKISASNLYNEIKQNFWHLTDMFEIIKLGHRLFKIDTAFAAVLEKTQGNTTDKFDIASKIRRASAQDNGLAAKQTKPSAPLRQADSLRSSGLSSASSADGGASVPASAVLIAQNPNKTSANKQDSSSSPSAQPSERALKPLTQFSSYSSGPSSPLPAGGGTNYQQPANTTSPQNAAAAENNQSSQSNNQSTNSDNSSSSNTSSTISSNSSNNVASSSVSSTLISAPLLDAPIITTLSPIQTFSTSTDASAHPAQWTTEPAIILGGTYSASSTAVFIHHGGDAPDILATLTTSTWSAQTALAEGANPLAVFAQNASGAQSLSASTTIWRDSTAPQNAAITTASSTKSALSIALSWSAQDALSGIAWFDIEIATSTAASSTTVSGATSSTFAWHTMFAHTTSTSAEVPGDDGVIHYFRLRAADKLGNTSDWQVSAPFTPTLPHTVVINEIAWAGTLASANDEWMELMNTGGAQIDLTGFRLNDGGDIDITFATGTIPAYGYWILERTTSTVMRRMAGLGGVPYGGLLSGTADGGIEILLSTGGKMRVGTVYKGALSNDGETLSLYDPQGVLLDKVTRSGGWIAGAIADTKKKTPPRSMQRIDPYASASAVDNWETNNGVQINGVDAGDAANPSGNSIYGTPLQPNKGYTAIFGTLASSTTLTASGGPYHLYNTSVPANVKLSIEKGAVIKAYSAALTVDGGTLQVSGDAEHPVVFTSAYDTVYGPLPLDQTPTSFHADYWQWIAARATSTVSFSRTLFRHGGYKSLTGSEDGVINIDNGSSATLNNVTLQENVQGARCGGVGSSLAIVSSILKSNGKGGVRGIDCDVTVQDTLIMDNIYAPGDTYFAVGVSKMRGSLLLENVMIQNTKAPSIVLDSVNSALIKNSSVASSPIGISITGGIQTIDNVIFSNMPLGVKQSGSASSTFINISNQNFSNVTTTSTPTDITL